MRWQWPPKWLTSWSAACRFAASSSSRFRGRCRQAPWGIRVAVAGRLNGSEIARSEWLAEGNVPLHTFRADVSYAARTAFTTYGTIGVKVWINRGELLPDEDEIGEERKARVTTPRPRRTSLADKARAAKPSRAKAKKK